MDLANLHPDLVDLNLLAGPSLPSPLCSPIVHVAAGQGRAARHHAVPQCESSSCEQRGEREETERQERERERELAPRGDGEGGEGAGGWSFHRVGDGESFAKRSGRFREAAE